jgi:hypothetical protein
MALCDKVITAALAKIGQDWTCEPVNDGWVLVTTSHQYSDGDYVEVLVRRDDDRSIEVSDGGEALARLDLASVSIESGRAKEMWRRLLRAHEVELNHERLTLQGSVEKAGWLVENMANAVANIDGLRLLAPPPQSPKFAERLVTFFQAEFEHVEEGPQIKGRSGVPYRTTAAVGDPERPTLVQAVAGTSKQARQRSIEHAFTMFSDINGQLPVTRKLAVLNEGDWKFEHTNLLSTVSYVGSWSYRDKIVGFITGSERPNSHLLIPSQAEFRAL